MGIQLRRPDPIDSDDAFGALVQALPQKMCFHYWACTSSCTEAMAHRLQQADPDYQGTRRFLQRWLESPQAEMLPGDYRQARYISDLAQEPYRALMVLLSGGGKRHHLCRLEVCDWIITRSLDTRLSEDARALLTLYSLLTIRDEQLIPSVRPYLADYQQALQQARTPGLVQAYLHILVTLSPDLSELVIFLTRELLQRGLPIQDKIIFHGLREVYRRIKKLPNPERDALRTQLVTTAQNLLPTLNQIGDSAAALSWQESLLFLCLRLRVPQWRTQARPYLPSPLPPVLRRFFPEEL